MMDLPDPPRHVPLRLRIRLSFSNPLVAVAGAILLLGPLPMFAVFSLVIFVGPDQPDFDLINQNGQDAEGEIISCEVDDNTTINGRPPRTVTYRYSVDGVSREDRYSTMSVAKADSLRPGGKVKVKHFEGDSVIPGLAPGYFPWWIFMALPGLFAVVGLSLLLYPIIQGRKRVHLYERGALVSGKVISVEERGLAFPAMPFPVMKREYNVAYSYGDGLGNDRVGRAKTADLTLIKSLEKEDAVKVLVDPVNPASSLLLDDAIAAELSMT